MSKQVTIWLKFSPFIIILAIVIVLLGKKIGDKNSVIADQNTVDLKVIQRLKVIQFAQRVFFDQHQRFTTSLDTLKDVLEKGHFYQLQIDTLIQKDELGFENPIYNIDTIGSTEVKDSLLIKYPHVTANDIDSLSFVPVSGKAFIVKSNRLEDGKVAVVVVDPAPLNPTRQEGGDKKPLQIGSLHLYTTSGNWRQTLN